MSEENPRNYARYKATYGDVTVHLPVADTQAVGQRFGIQKSDDAPNRVIVRGLDEPLFLSVQWQAVDLEVALTDDEEPHRYWKIAE